MRELTMAASRPSRMLIGGGLLDRSGELSLPLLEGRRALIAAGETVFGLYGERLRRALERAGFQVSACVYPSGEAHKTPETLLQIVGALAENGFSRADALFALGGGVTGDMAGLAAALYQRGLLPLGAVELWIFVVALYALRSARKNYLEAMDP